MAKWTDAQGVFHDTDALEYGNQGDTRYWTGTPGAVGSTTWDKPKTEAGAVETQRVKAARDPSKGPNSGPLYEMLKGAEKPVAQDAVSPEWAKQSDDIRRMFTGTYGEQNAPGVWTREHAAELDRLKGTAQAQEAGNRGAPASAVAASYRSPGGVRTVALDPDELVARLYHEQFGQDGTIEDARLAVWNIRRNAAPGSEEHNWYANALGMAREGQLNSYASSPVSSAPGVMAGASRPEAGAAPAPGVATAPIGSPTAGPPPIVQRFMELEDRANRGDKAAQAELLIMMGGGVPNADTDASMSAVLGGLAPRAGSASASSDYAPGDIKRAAPSRAGLYETPSMLAPNFDEQGYTPGRWSGKPTPDFGTIAPEPPYAPPGQPTPWPTPMPFDVGPYLGTPTPVPTPPTTQTPTPTPLPTPGRVSGPARPESRLVSVLRGEPDLGPQRRQYTPPPEFNPRWPGELPPPAEGYWTPRDLEYWALRLFGRQPPQDPTDLEVDYGFPRYSIGNV